MFFTGAEAADQVAFAVGSGCLAPLVGLHHETSEEAATDRMKRTCNSTCLWSIISVLSFYLFWLSM